MPEAESLRATLMRQPWRRKNKGGGALEGPDSQPDSDPDNRVGKVDTRVIVPKLCSVFGNVLTAVVEKSRSGAMFDDKDAVDDLPRIMHESFIAAVDHCMEEGENEAKPDCLGVLGDHADLWKVWVETLPVWPSFSLLIRNTYLGCSRYSYGDEPRIKPKPMETNAGLYDYYCSVHAKLKKGDFGHLRVPHLGEKIDEGHPWVNLVLQLWNAAFLEAAYNQQLQVSKYKHEMIQGDIGYEGFYPGSIYNEMWLLLTKRQHIHERDGHQYTVVSLVAHGSAKHQAGNFTKPQPLPPNVTELELLGWPGLLTNAPIWQELCDQRSYKTNEDMYQGIDVMRRKMKHISPKTHSSPPRDAISVVKVRHGNPRGGLYFDRTIFYYNNNSECTLKVCTDHPGDKDLERVLVAEFASDAMKKFAMSKFVVRVSELAEELKLLENRKLVIRVLSCFGNGITAPLQADYGSEVEEFFRVHGAQSMLTHARTMCNRAVRVLWDAWLYNGNEAVKYVPAPNDVDADIFEAKRRTFLRIKGHLEEPTVLAAVLTAAKANDFEGYPTEFLEAFYKVFDTVKVPALDTVKGPDPDALEPLRRPLRSLTCYQWLPKRKLDRLHDMEKGKHLYDEIVDPLEELVKQYGAVSNYIINGANGANGASAEDMERGRIVAKNMVYEDLSSDVWNLAYATRVLNLDRDSVAANIRQYIGTYNEPDFDRNQRPVPFFTKEAVYASVEKLYVGMLARMDAAAPPSKGGGEGFGVSPRNQGQGRRWVAVALSALALALAL